jgi:thiamine pyrophosphokinase
MIKRTVTRREDMSLHGNLTVHQQSDGDIVVAVYSDDPIWGTGGSIEFCAMGAGGGRSPQTLAALQDLMDAIERDNKERPI